jgi:hypothetical protein
MIAIATIATGCKGKLRGGEVNKSAGVRIADDGEVARVTASPDGKWIAFLGQVERPKDLGVPEGILTGLLELVPSDGASSARQLLGGVTNLEGAFGFAPDSSVLAALKGFRFGTHSGTLEAVRLDGKSEPVHLADDCSGFLFSLDAKHLAWVASDGAFLGGSDGAGSKKVAEGAATVEFSRDGKKLLVRKQASAGGDLVLVDVARAEAERVLAHAVGDYLFSPDGSDVAFTTHGADSKSEWSLQVTTISGGAPRTLGEGVTRFSFSPDGKWLGYIGGVSRAKAFGDLFVAATAGSSAGTRVGERVEQFQFSPGSDAVAFLEKYDANARSGTLSLQTLPPSAPAAVIHRPSKGFAWSPQGSYLAVASLVLKPAVSVDLELVSMKELKVGPRTADGGAGTVTGTRTVAAGVFGYDFLGEERIIYRTDCIMEGRACDLYVVPTAQAATPARMTGSVWRFTRSRDGQRMLLTFPRVDSETVADLGALNVSGYGGVAGLDKSVELGAVFLDPQGDRVAYGVIDKRRRGVYVARVPLAEAGKLPPSLEPPGFKKTYGSTGAR